MRYRLVIVTDGREGLLERTLDSFLSKVAPLPAEVAVVDDSGDEWYLRYLSDLLPSAFPDGVTVIHHPERQGFCASVHDAWQLAIRPGVDWVYWTEDDFLYHRGLDMRDLAFVLEREPQIAQMALMRDAVNKVERDAGGLYEMYRDRYEIRGTDKRWLLSRTNFSTTHSLMRRQFMADNPWPDPETVPASCEGIYSIGLLNAGFLFGVWGLGEPWTEHIGHARVGKGY